MIKTFKQVVGCAIGCISFVFAFVPEDVFDCFRVFSITSKEVNIIINRVILFLVVVALAAAAYAGYFRLRKKVHIKGKNYNIVVRYGNIFDMKKCKKVISFDECFTTEVGEAPAQVKPTSVCGQFLLKHPIGDIQPLIDKAQLKPCESKSKHMNRERYKPGSIVPCGDYLLMAFAKLDEEGLGRMTRDEYLDSLFLLWKEIDKHYGQTDICIPILGSGITRMEGNSLTQQELLDMMIASYKLSAHKIKAPSTLHIVCMRQDCFSLNKIGEKL